VDEVASERANAPQPLVAPLGGAGQPTGVLRRLGPNADEPLHVAVSDVHVLLEHLIGHCLGEVVDGGEERGDVALAKGGAGHHADGVHEHAVTIAGLVQFAQQPGEFGLVLGQHLLAVLEKGCVVARLDAFAGREGHAAVDGLVDLGLLLGGTVALDRGSQVDGLEAAAGLHVEVFEVLGRAVHNDGEKVVEKLGDGAEALATVDDVEGGLHAVDDLLRKKKGGHRTALEHVGDELALFANGPHERPLVVGDNEDARLELVDELAAAVVGEARRHADDGQRGNGNAATAKAGLGNHGGERRAREMKELEEERRE